MWRMLTCIPWRRAVRGGAPRRRVRPEAECRDAEERLLGCGWFDSSHELERGLQVSEADAVALGSLPVADWIDLELSGWRPAPAVA